MAEAQARLLGESVGSMGKRVAQLAGGIDGVVVGSAGEGEEDTSGGSGGVLGSVASLESSVAGSMGTDSSGRASTSTNTAASMLGRAAKAVGELAAGCSRGAERTVVLRGQLAQAGEALAQLGERYTVQEREVGERLGGWEQTATEAATAVASVNAEQRECMLQMVAAKQQAGYGAQRGGEAAAGCFDEHAAKASKKAREWCEAQAAAAADLVGRIEALKGLAAAARREQESGLAAAKTEVRGCAREVGEGVGQQLQALQAAIQTTVDTCRECVAEHEVECCSDPAGEVAGGVIGRVVEKYLEEEGTEAEAETARVNAVLLDFEAQRRDQVS
jgi:hypothetical protein